MQIQSVPSTTNPDVRSQFFTLAGVQHILEEKLKIGLINWVSAENQRGILTTLYRKYYDGDHPANMTSEMRSILRASRPGVEFCDNYMPMVVDTMSDRLIVESIEGDDDDAQPAAPVSSTPAPEQPAATQPQGSPATPTPAPKADADSPSTKWSQELLDTTRFDELQNDVMRAVLTDANTYVMVSYDNDKQSAMFTHEQAFDGLSGVVMLYESGDAKKPLAAVKIWHTTIPGYTSGYVVRVNVYYPDHIERYITEGGDGSGLVPYSNPDTGENPVDLWTDALGKPLGIPIFHFRNGGRFNFGNSELRDAITLQDALDRNWYSMVMATEMTAFPIYFAKGFKVGSAMTPGMIVSTGDIAPEDAPGMDFKKIEGSDLSQYVNNAQFIAGEIARITATPAPEMLGSAANLSGEALKQLEIRLIGKVERAQVRFGSTWEDCMAMAVAATNAFGTKKAPTVKRWHTKWKDAQLRNDQQLIQNATAIENSVPKKWFLRAIASVFGWDEATIEQILAEAQAEQNQQMAQMASMMPAFQNYPKQFGSGPGKPPNPNGSENPSLPPGTPAGKAA